MESSLKEKCLKNRRRASPSPSSKAKEMHHSASSTYRGVRLLELGMKLFEKVLENRLREKVSIGKCQFGFCQGRLTKDAVYVMRQLQEKYSEKKKTLHMYICRP